MIKFRLFSVDVKVSFHAFALLTFSVIASGKDSVISLCVLSSLIHEFFHILFILRYKGKPRGISFSCEGLTIHSNNEVLSFKQEMAILSAGVISNFILFICFFFLNNRFRQSFFIEFAMCNLCLGILNSLPLRSLDGGQMLLCVLRQRYDLHFCDIVLNIVSFVIVVPVTVLGILVLYVSRYNYSLLFISIYLFSVITSKEMR